MDKIFLTEWQYLKMFETILNTSSITIPWCMVDSWEKKS